MKKRVLIFFIFLSMLPHVPVYADITYPGDIYVPEINIEEADYETMPDIGGAAASYAPIIGESADTVYPDETLSVTGEGLAGARLMIWSDGEMRTVTPLRSDNTKLQAVIPKDFKRSMMIVWPIKDGRVGECIRVNAPKLKWADSEYLYSEEEGELCLYGTNLCIGENTAAVYLKPDGGEYVIPDILESNPYKIRVKIPKIYTEGNAKIYVHNGTGGKYGFSECININIRKRNTAQVQSLPVIYADDFGAAANDGADDYAAINSAVERAYEIGGAIVKLGEGEYNISREISLCENDIPVVIKGEGSGEYDKISDLSSSEWGIRGISGKHTSLAFTSKTDLPMYMIRLGNNKGISDISLFGGDDGNTDSSGLSNTVVNINGVNTFIKGTRIIKYDLRDFNEYEKSSYGVGTCVFAERGSKYINIDACEFHCYGTAIYMPSVQYVYGWGWYSDEWSAEYVKINGCSFYGYGNKPYLKNDTSTFNATAAMSFSNICRISVEGCTMQSFDRENGYILCRTMYVGGSGENMYIANNRIINAGPHPSAECDGNMGEQFLFHGVGTGGSIFNISECSGTRLKLRKDNIKTTDDGGNKINRISSMDNSGSEIARGMNLGTKWMAYITAGKGRGQYRRIMSCIDSDDSAELILEREWSIEPDENSVILLFAPYNGITIYKNTINNRQLLQRGYKSGAVLFFFDAADNVVAENDFNNVVFGVAFNTSFKQPVLYNRVRDNKMSGMREIYNGAMQGGDTTVHAAFFAENGGSNAGQEGDYDSYNAWYTVGNSFVGNECSDGDFAAEQTIRPWHKRIGKKKSEAWYGEEKGQMMLVFENNTFSGVSDGLDIGNSASWTLDRNNSYTFTSKDGYSSCETVFEDSEEKLRYMKIREDELVSDVCGTAGRYSGLYSMSGAAGIIPRAESKFSTGLGFGASYDIKYADIGGRKCMFVLTQRGIRLFFIENGYTVSADETLYSFPNGYFHDTSGCEGGLITEQISGKTYLYYSCVKGDDSARSVKPCIIKYDVTNPEAPVFCAEFESNASPGYIRSNSYKYIFTYGDRIYAFGGDRADGINYRGAVFENSSDGAIHKPVCFIDGEKLGDEKVIMHGGEVLIYGTGAADLYGINGGELNKLQSFTLDVTSDEDAKISSADFDDKRIVCSVNESSGAKEGLVTISRESGVIKNYIAPRIKWRIGEGLGIKKIKLKNNHVYAVCPSNKMYASIKLGDVPFIEKMAYTPELNCIDASDGYVVCAGYGIAGSIEEKLNALNYINGDNYLRIYYYTFNLTNEDKQISVYTHITSAEGEKRVSAGNIAIPAGDIVQRQFSVNGISSYGENADFTTFFWMDETPCTYKVQK